MTDAQPAPELVIVSGPSGVGKPTVAHLLALRFDRSVVIGADAFTNFVRAGAVEPWRAEADHQNRVVGGALAAAAFAFVDGGYTVLVDGHIFPDGARGFVHLGASRHITVRYMVLRADLTTCRSRASARGAVPSLQLFDELHARFERSGVETEHHVDASGPVDEVVEAVWQRLIEQARHSRPPR